MLTFEPRNITTTSDSTGTLLSWDIHRQTPLLSEVVIFLSSVVVSTPNGQCLDCATVAFREQYKLDLVGVQEVRLDKGGMVRFYSMEKETKWINWERNFLYTTEQYRQWKDESSGSGMWGHGLDRSGSGEGKLAGTCKCGNECSGSIKCGEFLD